jgi:hypothetical protein
MAAKEQLRELSDEEMSDGGSSVDSAEEVDSADGEWEDWQDEEPNPCKCLFCDEVLDSAAAALEHSKNGHGYDLLAVRKERGKVQWNYMETLKD